MVGGDGDRTCLTLAVLRDISSASLATLQYYVFTNSYSHSNYVVKFSLEFSKDTKGFFLKNLKS